jgi:hypothetical protein
MTILLWQGSSYPDINGTIGILFEQASSRGHAQSANGILTFPFTIEINLQPVYQPCKQQLKCVKSCCLRDFYKNAKTESSKSKVKGYVLVMKDAKST